MQEANTSLMAYFDVCHKLSEKQEIVLTLLRNNGNMSNTDIARALKWPINCVTPRVKELRDQRRVMLIGYKECPVTHKTVKVWGAVGFY